MKRIISYILVRFLKYPIPKDVLKALSRSGKNGLGIIVHDCSLSMQGLKYHVKIGKVAKNLWAIYLVCGGGSKCLAYFTHVLLKERVTLIILCCELFFQYLFYVWFLTQTTLTIMPDGVAMPS